MIFSIYTFWNRWFTVNIYSETDDLTVNIYSETDDFPVYEYSETDNSTLNIHILWKRIILQWIYNLKQTYFTVNI